MLRAYKTHCKGISMGIEVQWRGKWGNEATQIISKKTQTLKEEWELRVELQTPTYKRLYVSMAL